MQQNQLLSADSSACRGELPIPVILFHMVDFGRIRNLPVNADCTELLMKASARTLQKMYPSGGVDANSFLPRRCEFQTRLESEIEDYRHGVWNFSATEQKKATLNDNALSFS